MRVKFKKLKPEAVTPSYSRPGDAGLDLTAISYNYETNAGIPYYNYEFGLSVEIPDGFVGLIFPRSSISNKDMQLSNAVGVIDSNYRGPLSARFKVINFRGEMPVIYKAGERVAQLVILPCLHADLIEVDELSDSVRGSGGFGSSGK